MPEFETLPGPNSGIPLLKRRIEEYLRTHEATLQTYQVDSLARIALDALNEIPDEWECVFCQKVTDDRASMETYSDKTAVFEPLNPVTPGHRLVIPFEHVASAAISPEITGRVMTRAARVAQDMVHNGECEAFNLITSAGQAATQTVSHLHVHIVPRRGGDGLSLPWTGQQ